MGRIKKALVVTTLAVGSISLGASPALAGSGDGLVDIVVGDITVVDDVTVAAAALICGVDLEILTADLKDDGKANCHLLGGIVKD